MPSPSRLPSRGILGLSEAGIIWLCYILYATALFLGGVPAVIACIINYVKRADARAGSGSALLLSHMQWQMDTFWLTLLLSLCAGLASFLLFLSVVGVFLLYPLWIALLLWYIYRIIRGMLAINDGRAVTPV